MQEAQEQLKAVNTKLAASEQDCKSLEAAALHSDSLEAEQQCLTQQLQQAHSNVHNLHEQHQQANARIAALETELESVGAESQEMSEQRQLLQDRCDRLQSDLAASQAQGAVHVE